MSERRILAGIDTAGPWAMSLPHLEAFLGELEVAVGLAESDPKAKARMSEMSSAVDDDSLPYELDGRTARVAVRGTILKSVPWIMKLLGMSAASTAEIGAALSHAMQNKDVDNIELSIDSPGGTVAGVQELADTIRGMSKPVSARVSDLCASAAYWLASQASGISANPGANVGSIGVYTVVRDTSRMAENAGIKVHVLASHPLKGAGAPGSVVTDEQLADTQRLINATADMFNACVERGRGMTKDQVAKVATGQVWLAAEAQKLGLIDHVGSVNAVIAAAGSLTKPMMGATMECEMDPKTQGTVAATNGDTEAIKAQLAEVEAKNLRLEAEIAAGHAREEAKLANDRSALVAKYADRYAPAGKDGIEKAVAAMDIVAAEKWLCTFPVITRTERVSSAGVTTETAAKPVASTLAKAADEIGADAGDMEFAAQFEQFTADGFCVRHDGTKIRKANWMAEKANWLKKMGYVAAMLVCVAFSGTANAAALTTAKNTVCKGPGHIQAYLMKASTQIYAGGLVMVDANGVALPAAASASNKGVVGVAQESKLSTAGGSYWIKVQDQVICDFTSSGLAQTNVGDLYYGLYDSTITSTASNLPVAGILVQYVSATEGWFYIDAAVNCGRANTITQPITLSADLTLANGETIGNTVNNRIKFTGDTEDVSFDLGTSNTLKLISGSAVDTVDIGAMKLKTTGDAQIGGTLDITTLSGSGAVGVGLTAANGANTACNTTCGGSTCFIGWDQGTTAFVACSSALADSCICLP